MKRALIFLLAVIVPSILLGQEAKYWVYFADKVEEDLSMNYVSAEAYDNRAMLGLPLRQWTDLPVNPQYLQTVTAVGGEVEVSSKWLNASSVRLSQDELVLVKSLPFVLGVSAEVPELTPASYGVSWSPEGQYWDLPTNALDQMEASAFAEANLDGKGVVIGVIDGNFWGANQNTALDDILEESRLLGTRDFIDPAADFFDNNPQGNDLHGHYVWQMMAGYDKEEEKQFGFAHGASFYLARTDDKYKEQRVEEDRWVAAIEWLDSLGVRLVSSSLGYSYGFDDKAENYAPEQMDGNTTVISKAAKMAVEEKGMIVVTSAGNEGKDRRWRVVSAPADVQGVIAVGASGIAGERAETSSIGVEGLAYVKPDVMAYSSNGSSLSAPMVSGFIACLLQKDPSLSNEQVLRVLNTSASQYPYANNYTGLGTPRASVALSFMDGDETATAREVEVTEGSYELKSDQFGNGAVTILHKNGEHWVVEQEVKEWEGNALTIKRPKKADRTTITNGSATVEIIWK